MAFAPQPAPATPYPEGAPGIVRSVQEVAQAMRDGRLDPDLRAWAIDVLTAAGLDGRNNPSIRAQANALLNALRAATIYVPDPSGAEWIQKPHVTLCLRDRCIRGGDCIPEETLLLRDDYELVPIENVRPGQKIWGRAGWTRVEAVQRKGRLAVDAIEMNNGSTMYLTPGHKVYIGECRHGRLLCPTCSGSDRIRGLIRIEVRDLTADQALLQPERIDFGSGSMDRDIAYVEGLFISEGWAEVEEGRFAISGQDGQRKEKLKHEVREICDRLGVHVYMHRKYVRVQDSAWTGRLAELGDRARFKHVRSMDLDEVTAKEILRGVMSDSTANTDGPGRTFSTTSHTLMVQTRVLHRMFGISTSVRMLTPEQHRGEGKHPLWRVGVRVLDKVLAVKSIERNVARVPCWDVQTEDHYVYLPEHDVTVSNCDDLTSALGGAMLSIGLPAYAVKADYGPSHQQHILNGVIDEQGNALYVDLSTNEGVQTAIPHVVDEEWINPLDMSSKATGTSSAEMVTLGKPMKRELYYKAGHWFEFRYGQWWMHAGGKWLAGPSEVASRGLPGMGRPYKRGGSYWASVGSVDVELAPGQAGLGTIFGYHTIHELSDLLAALTYQVTQITNAYTSASSQWQVANQAEWSAWTASYNAALAAWTTEAAAAQAMITASTASGNAPSDYVLTITTGGDDEFDKLAQAFDPFEALDRQLRQATAFPFADLPTYSSTPQPTAPDLDLAAYQLADNAWQKVKQVGMGIQDRLEQAAPYIAIAGAAVAIYAVYRVGEMLPRGRRA